MACASSCFNLYRGMGGSALLPVGPRPVSRNLTNPSSFQRVKSLPAPVRSGDVLCHPFISCIGAKSRVAPLSHLALSNSPVSSQGVWHAWHLPTSSTRYLPRATLSESAAIAAERATKMHRSLIIALWYRISSAGRSRNGLPAQVG